VWWVIVKPHARLLALGFIPKADNGIERYVGRFPRSASDNDLALKCPKWAQAATNRKRPLLCSTGIPHHRRAAGLCRLDNDHVAAVLSSSYLGND
jgi:hypothetical protein